MNPNHATTPGATESLDLLDVPREFDGTRIAQDLEPVRRSLQLARARREALTVVELDDPTTTTFALFLD